MTDEEFARENKGTRGFFVLFAFIMAVAVGLQTWSLSWFWITLLAISLMRIAAIAAMLDKIDNARHDSTSQASEARLK